MANDNSSTEPTFTRLKPRSTFYEQVILGTFDCVNWLAALAIFMFSIFTYVRAVDTTMFDMTQYCDDGRFNNEATPVNLVFPMAVLGLLFFVTAICLTGRMLVANRLLEKDIKNAVHFILGFILTWDVCAVLQNMVSFPAPSFYQEPELFDHYCCSTCPEMNMTKIGKILDENARESFPSIFTAVSWYLIAYAFILVYYMDCVRSFAIKILTLLIPSLITLHYMILLWKNHQNHDQDLFVGSVIGMTMAVFVMNDFHPLIKPRDWMLGDDEDEKDEVSIEEGNATPIAQTCDRPPTRNVPVPMIYPALDFPMKELIALGTVREAPAPVTITEITE